MIIRYRDIKKFLAWISGGKPPLNPDIQHRRLIDIITSPWESPPHMGVPLVGKNDLPTLLTETEKRRKKRGNNNQKGRRPRA